MKQILKEIIKNNNILELNKQLLEAIDDKDTIENINQRIDKVKKEIYTLISIYETSLINNK